MALFLQILGWIGTFLILAAYFLVSNKRLSATSALFQWLNLIGAISIGAYVFYQQAWPAVALEVVWAAIALTALIQGKKKVRDA